MTRQPATLAATYDNAFWNGQQMVFGDGDGVIFTGFTGCLDVIGHELTHGETAYDDPKIGKDPQPADMAHYVHTASDNGGVHITSGIPNHAFYLAAIDLGGYAWEKAGRIWYDALCDHGLKRSATFSTFAHLTVRHAALH